MGRGLRELVHGGQGRAVQWTAVSVHCGPSVLSFPLWFTMHRVLLSFSHLLLSLLLRAHIAAPLSSLPAPLLCTTVPGRQRRWPNGHPGDFDEWLSGARALHEHGGGTGEVDRAAWCPQLWFPWRRGLMRAAGVGATGTTCVALGCGPWCAIRDARRAKEVVPVNIQHGGARVVTRFTEELWRWYVMDNRQRCGGCGSGQHQRRVPFFD